MRFHALRDLPVTAQGEPAGGANRSGRVEVRIALDGSHLAINCRQIAIRFQTTTAANQKLRNTSRRLRFRNTANAASPAAMIFEMMSPLSGPVRSNWPMKVLP